MSDAPGSTQTLARRLLRWFERHARKLPWRENYDPYAVWISEIMLQQTQMETVLPYFNRWMKAFPDVRSLAAADEDKVLKLWEGLGYYSRARNLLSTARRLAAEFGGELPRDEKTLRSLKGIGRYTAGAIASIAFNEPRPIVDGNVIRVLTRCFGIDEPADAPAVMERLWQLEASLIPRGRAREFNQSLMELGALVCLPKDPGCGHCPIRDGCRARLLGRPEAYPVRAPRKAAVRITAAAVVLERSGRYLVWRRPVGSVMGGLWEFPEWKLSETSASGSAEVLRDLRRLARETFGKNLRALTPLGTLRRSYTHHRETLHVFHAAWKDAGAPAFKNRWPVRWASPDDFEELAFSSAHAKIARLIGSGRSRAAGQVSKLGRRRAQKH